MSRSAAKRPAGPAPTTTVGRAARTSRSGSCHAGSGVGSSSIHARTRRTYTGARPRASIERRSVATCVTADAAAPSRRATASTSASGTPATSGGRRSSTSRIRAPPPRAREVLIHDFGAERAGAYFGVLLAVASTHYDRGVTSTTGSVAPLDGIRVLEVANWLAAPAAGALLADLGADVIKVEPPGGDVFREFVLRSMGYRHDFATNYAFQLDNRGKRSVTVALDRPGGPALLRRMSERVDVFLTNLVQQRRERYGLTYDEVRAVSPRIVYASFSGDGTRGPDRNRPGFDYAAFWARSGLMGLLGEPPSPPPLCRGGQGDHTTALNILAAVLAALRLRDQTNEAQHCEVTLQATGMWTLAGDIQAA